MSKAIRLVCSGVNMIQRHTDALLHYCLHARKNMTVFIIRPELHCFAYYSYSNFGFQLLYWFTQVNKPSSVPSILQEDFLVGPTVINALLYNHMQAIMLHVGPEAHILKTYSLGMKAVKSQYEIET